MFSKKSIITFSLAFLGFLFYTQPAFAATLSLSPGSGNINKGGTLTVTVRVNAGSDAVNAVSAYLSYPADKLDVAWVNYGSSAFGIEAENTYGGGNVRISRGSVSAVSGNATVATIGFRGKALGSAAVSFVAGSAAPRASDSSDSLNLGGSSGGNFTVVEAPPEAPKDTTAPKITDVSVADVSSNSATITWKTDEKSDSFLEYGLEKEKYFLTASNGDLTTDHTLKVEGPILVAGAKFHYRVKSKDAAGNQAVGEDSLFQLKGYQVKVKVIDSKNNPVVGAEVLLYSEPTTATTDAKGEVSFTDITPGKHLILIKSNGAEKTKEIMVTDSSAPQVVTVIFTPSAVAEAAEKAGGSSGYLIYIIVAILVIIAGGLLLFFKVIKKRSKAIGEANPFGESKPLS